MKPQQLKAIAQRAAIEMLEREGQNIRQRVVTAMMAATLLTLHDKYDWTPDRLKKIMEEIFQQFECVIDKYVKIEDFFEELRNMGIDVKEG